MKRQKIILIIIPIAVSIFSSAYFAWHFSQPNPTLNISGPWTTVGDREIDFELSNDQSGIAYLNKIELIVEKFEILEGCDGPIFYSLKPPRYFSHPINIEAKPNLYSIDILYDKTNEPFQTSEGLKYAGGDVNQFTIPYGISPEILNYTHGYSFDYVIKAYWCENSSRCDNYKIIESIPGTVERLGTCKDIDINKIIP